MKRGGGGGGGGGGLKGIGINYLMGPLLYCNNNTLQLAAKFITLVYQAITL